MPPKMIRNTIAWFLLITASQATAQTLEVRLLRHPVRLRHVVRLGHVAVLDGLPKSRLRALETLTLCPAPSPGDRVVLTRDELRRILVLAGVPGRSIRFTGMPSVVLTSVSQPAASTPSRESPAVTPASANTPAGDPSTIRVLVPARFIPAGQVLRASDVRLIDWPHGKGKVGGDVSGFVQDEAEIVGLETQQSLTPGQPIPRRALRSPLVIRRRDSVLVEARVRGITVRTIAVAKADARMGEVVQLENPETREVFAATAAGPRFAQLQLVPLPSRTQNKKGGQE